MDFSFIYELVDSLYSDSTGRPAWDPKLSYIGSYLADARSRVILDARAGIPGIDTESSMAVEMLDSLAASGLLPAVRILIADANYGNTGFLCERNERGVTPHIPLLFGAAPEPALVWKTRTTTLERLSKREIKIREVRVRNHAREMVKTVGYAVSQKLRKRSGHLFAEAKAYHGLGQARGRGKDRLQEQLNMAAVGQGIKRMVSFCSRQDREKGRRTPFLHAPYRRNSLPCFRIFALFTSYVCHFLSGGTHLIILIYIHSGIHPISPDF